MKEITCYTCQGRRYTYLRNGHEVPCEPHQGGLCPDCRGKGTVTVEDSHRKLCYTCQGRGYTYLRNGHEVPCESHQGSRCQDCGGSGYSNLA